MSSPEGYNAIPREDPGNASQQQRPASDASEPTKQGFPAKIQGWWARNWGSLRTENTPLINRNRMTLEAPRKSSFRVFLEILVIVGIFILAASIILLVANTNEQTGGNTRPSCFWLCELNSNFDI
jgi:hypothetical protein